MLFGFGVWCIWSCLRHIQELSLQSRWKTCQLQLSSLHLGCQLVNQWQLHKDCVGNLETHYWAMLHLVVTFIWILEYRPDWFLRRVDSYTKTDCIQITVQKLARNRFLMKASRIIDWPCPKIYQIERRDQISESSSNFDTLVGLRAYR
jgi:hypothetical protein